MWISVFVLLVCSKAAWSQKCFSYHCPHHEVLLENCAQGQWLCGADEYCHVETHTYHGHGNSAYHILNCRHVETLPTCVADYARNDPACDPNRHNRACSWCCDTMECVHQLAAGHYTPPDGFNVVLSTPPPTTPLHTSEPKIAGRCAECSGLDCLLGDTSGKKCFEDQPYCFTSVTDTPTGRMNILRRCASQADCDAIQLIPSCRAANSVLHINVVCKFCCNEPDCNIPPNVVPMHGLMTHH